MGVIGLLLGAITFQLVGIFCRERIAPSREKNGVVANFKMMLRNKPYRQLLLSGILGGTRNLTLLVTMSVVTFYFAAKDPTLFIVYLVLLGGGLFGGMALVTVFVPKLLGRFSRKKLYNFSNIAELPANLLIFLFFMIKPDGLTLWYFMLPLAACFTVKGVCMGLYSTLQTIMIGDCVDYEEHTNNVRPDAVFFSGQTFLVKIGTSFSNGIYFLLRSLVGYSDENARQVQAYADSGEKTIRETIGSDFFGTVGRFFRGGMGATGQVVQTGLQITNDQLFIFIGVMFFCMSVLPAIGNILGLLPTLHYTLDDAECEKVHAAVRARHEES
jgi:Na+/melibiose symporter-like transporter